MPPSHPPQAHMLRMIRMKHKRPILSTFSVVALNLVPRVALTLLLIATFFPLMNIIRGYSPVAQAADSNEPVARVGITGTSATTGTTGRSSTVDADKDEILYVLLDGKGTPSVSYVINHFKVNEAGTLVDHGIYDSTINLTSTEPLATLGNQISVPVEKGEFYYEGVLTKVELPWVIEIVYTLDGKKIEPTQLAGKSGKLEIEIKTSQNKKADPIFYEHYLLQIQLTIASAKVRGLDAPGATVANAGKNEQIVFMVLPGKLGNLKLSAQVTEFEMAGIQISGMPFSMAFDIPDTSSMVDGMSKLTDAIGELNDGVGKLKDGIGQLQGGASSLSNGSAEMGDGLAQLGENGSALADASGQINTALAIIAEQLGGADIDPDMIAQLIDGLQRLADALSESDLTGSDLIEALILLRDGIEIAIDEMDAMIQGFQISSDDEIAALLAEIDLGSLSAEAQATIDKLIATNSQASALVDYYWSSIGIREGLSYVLDALDAAIANADYLMELIDYLTDELKLDTGMLSDLPLLIDYLQQLSGGYSAFHEGLVSYTDGVSKLAQNYGSFDDGLNQFFNGTGSLYDGIAALHSGTTELYVNVEDLPKTMQEEIDSFLKDYQGSDFPLKSFISSENKSIARVQFIMLSDPIEIPDSGEKSSNTEPVQKSFWDRLSALFG